MSDWNLERAKRALSQINWKTTNRPFTQDETGAVEWAAVACYHGEITVYEFSELLGGVSVDVLIATLYNS